MDGDKKGDYPTGSSGGGGKRGYGVRNSFLFPYGANESPPSIGGDSDESDIANRSAQDRSSNEDNVIDWIDGRGSGFELVRTFNGHDENRESTASSSDQEYQENLEHYDGKYDRADDAEVSGRPARMGYAAIIGYAGYVGCPNVQGGYRYAGFFGAPVQGQAALALRYNANNHIEYNGRLDINNEIHVGALGEHIGNNGVVQGQAAEVGGMYEIRRDGDNMNRIRDGSIFYYATMTAYAHRRLNGDILSEMLSLRDSHVFNIMNSSDYSDAIRQICNNPDLAEAMINHLDCMKALLSRNLQLALTKQIACVNAVMKLLNDPYGLQEEWTLPVINTVTFDLRIISMKASTGSRGRDLIRYNWVVNHLACLFHPANCQCHPDKLYRTRNFYRRF